MAQLIWTGFAVVAGFVMVGVVLYFLVTEGGDRERDEAARVFFDEHGHWPDEPAGAVDAVDDEHSGADGAPPGRG